MILKILVVHQSYSLPEICMLYLSGNAGTGGYFVIVYIQMVLMFPVINVLIHQKKNYVWVVLAINFMFEIVVWIADLYDLDLLNFYKLCGLRYLAFVGAGTYCFYYGYEIKKNSLIIAFIAGVIYIIAYAYFGWKPIFNAYWHHSSFYTVLYIMPIVMWLIAIDGKLKNRTLLGNMLKIIGQNSFYIFCTQMAFFTSKYSWHLGNVSKIYMCLFAILICTTVGIVFGWVMQLIKIDYIRRKS